MTVCLDPPAPRGIYTTLSRLAMGAMGEVTLARCDDGSTVVVKRMHRHCAVLPELVQMFHHEARLLGAIEHPGVVKLREFARDAQGLMMVIEHLPGVDLTELQGKISRECAVEVLLQLLSALSAVHGLCAGGASLGVVHADLCPANVRVTLEGDVKLMDFGIATSAWRVDPDRGRMKGTRGYMAPEVITGEYSADARADVFASAVILYELSTGKRLFEGSAAEVMTAIVEAPIARPREFIRDYPSGLQDVLMRGLAREVGERFGSAEEMATALAQSVSLERRAARAALAGSALRLRPLGA